MFRALLSIKTTKIISHKDQVAVNLKTLIYSDMRKASMLIQNGKSRYTLSCSNKL